MDTRHQYESFMQHAITLALRSRWQTAPNPSVGAVLVKDGEIVAEGWHKGTGQAHAEAEVLSIAQQQNIPLAECTLVATLEPCHHHGKMPPCTLAIMESGIRKVVVGTLDPNPEASGGTEYLRSHGIEVITGVLEQQCQDLIDDFITWQSTEFPYTIIKLASTLDGRIATRTGHSKWVSSEQSRQSVHAFRRHMNAILVGGNTFHRDNPQLTCRDLATGENIGQQPLAIVATSRLPEAGANYHLIQDRPEQTIFWTTIATAASPKAEALRKLGVRVMGLPSLPLNSSPAKSQGHSRGQGMRSQLDLTEGIRSLRKELGCLYLLCEGGGKLALSLLESNLARELHLHIAPKILGDNEATPLFDGRNPDYISEALQLRLISSCHNDFDVILSLKPGELPPAESKE